MRCSTCGARARPCSGGLPRCPPSWSARGLGCCVAQACMALASGRVEAVDALLDAAERALTRGAPMSPSSRRSARASLLVNVPATIATQRAYLAELRGDAEGTAAFASRALAEIGDGEWMLESVSPVASGRRRLAARPTGRGRARACCRPSPDGGRPASAPSRSGHLSPRPGPARPGRLDAAPAPTGRPWRSARLPAARPCPALASGYEGLAEVAYQRNELDAALRHVTRRHPAVPAVQSTPRRWLWAGDAGLDPAGQG